MLLVMKFGGTSVGSAERIAQAAELVLKSAREGHQVVVVTSAMSGVTNKLIAAAENAVKGHWHKTVGDELYEPHRQAVHLLIADDAPRRLWTLDVISGLGEMLCAPLLSGAIAARGQASTPVEATQLIVTDDQFGHAEPL